MAKLLIATFHEAEFAELAAHLAADGWEAVRPLESGASHVSYNQGGGTHREQALKRAEAFAAAAGLPALALATALEVYALDKNPGLRTHEYAGPAASDAEHRAKLLNALRRVPVGQRIALFQASAALVAPGAARGRVTSSTLECEVTMEERGEGGLLFDAVTQLNDRRTLAEMDDETRWRMGHRGMAMKQMGKHLAEVRQSMG